MLIVYTTNYTLHTIPMQLVHLQFKLLILPPTSATNQECSLGFIFKCINVVVCFHCNVFGDLQPITTFALKDVLENVSVK